MTLEELFKRSLARDSYDKRPRTNFLTRGSDSRYGAVGMNRELKPSGVFDGVEVYPIPGWEGFYSVSRCGKVWSHKRLVNHRQGVIQPRSGRWLKPSPTSGGYPGVTLKRPEEKKKTFHVHRLMAQVFLGVSDSQWVDHIDRDRSNNNLENLRVGTPSQNQSNFPPHPKNTSGFIGVYWSKGKWAASVGFKGKVHYLGRFDYPEDAARERDIRAKGFHGEFATLNFPSE